MTRAAAAAIIGLPHEGIGSSNSSTSRSADSLKRVPLRDTDSRRTEASVDGKAGVAARGRAALANRHKHASGACRSLANAPIKAVAGAGVDLAPDTGRSATTRPKRARCSYGPKSMRLASMALTRLLRRDGKPACGPSSAGFGDVTTRPRCPDLAGTREAAVVRVSLASVGPRVRRGPVSEAADPGQSTLTRSQPHSVGRGATRVSSGCCGVAAVRVFAVTPAHNVPASRTVEVVEVLELEHPPVRADGPCGSWSSTSRWSRCLAFKFCGRLSHR